jgi:hypothetical protein
MTHTQISGSSVLGLTAQSRTAVLLAVFLIGGMAVHARISDATATGATPSQGNGSSSTTSGAGLDVPASAAPLSLGSDTSGLSINSPDTGLSTRQIFNLLEEKPEVVVELKQLLADTLSQQGVSVDPNSVTDEMLYRQIASSREIRMTITLFLRGRSTHISAGHLRELWRAATCNPPHGCWSGGCQKKGDGRRGMISPTPLMGFPEICRRASVSGRGLQDPRFGRRGFSDSLMRVHREWATG